MSITQKWACGGDVSQVPVLPPISMPCWAGLQQDPSTIPLSILPSCFPSLLPPSTPREAVLLFYFSFLPPILPSCMYKSLIKLSLHQRTAQGTGSRMAHGILGLLRPLQSRLSPSRTRLVLLCAVTEQHQSPARGWAQRGFSSTHQDGPGESRWVKCCLAASTGMEAPLPCPVAGRGERPAKPWPLGGGG